MASLFKLLDTSLPPPSSSSNTILLHIMATFPSFIFSSHLAFLFIIIPRLALLNLFVLLPFLLLLTLLSMFLLLFFVTYTYLQGPITHGPNFFVTWCAAPPPPSGAPATSFLICLH